MSPIPPPPPFTAEDFSRTPPPATGPGASGTSLPRGGGLEELRHGLDAEDPLHGRWSDLWTQLTEYLKLKRGPIHLGHNALAGLSYTFGVVLLGGFQIATGFALFSQDAPTGPMNRVFGWLLPLLGGPFRTTSLHLLAGWLVATFVILRVYVVIYDATQYRNGLVSAMITGRKFYQALDKVQDTWLG